MNTTVVSVKHEYIISGRKENISDNKNTYRLIFGDFNCELETKYERYNLQKDNFIVLSPSIDRFNIKEKLMNYFDYYIIEYNLNTDLLKPEKSVFIASKVSMELIILFNEINSILRQSNPLSEGLLCQLSMIVQSIIVVITSKEKIQKRVVISKHVTQLNHKLLKVNQYIDEHYDKPLTLRILAELVNCNPIYLSNSYARLFKNPPMRHLQYVRMTNASKLLYNTFLSVNEISQKVGYISVSQFCKVFKRYYEVTPMQYRKNRLNYNKEQIRGVDDYSPLIK